MFIRKATADDLPRIVELGSRSLVDGPYAGIIKDNPMQTAKLAAHILVAGTVLLAEDDDGCVCGLLGFIVTPHHFSGELYAAELMWYVLPEYRRMTSFTSSPALNLLREAERLAKQEGAKDFVFTSPDDKVSALYHRCGYSKLEVNYRKAL